MTKASGYVLKWALILLAACGGWVDPRPSEVERDSDESAATDHGSDRTSEPSIVPVSDFDVFMSPVGGFASLNHDRVIEPPSGAGWEPTIENAALDLLRRAGTGTEVRIAMYSLSSSAVHDEIFRASARGAKIKVLLDAVKEYDRASREQFAEKNRREGHPVQLKLITENRMKSLGRSRKLPGGEILTGTMHEKFAIFESKDAVEMFVGSANLSDASNHSLAENRIVARNDVELAMALNHEFAVLWENFGECVSGNCAREPVRETMERPRLRFLANSAGAFATRPLERRTIELLEGAFRQNGTLDIAVFYFSNRELGEALIDAASRAPQTTIRLLLDQSMQDVSKDPEVLGPWLAREVESRGLENLVIRYSIGNPGYKMHHKFFIVNGDTLVNGSFNWTPMGDINIENMLIVEGGDEPSRNVISRFQGEFESLWARAK